MMHVSGTADRILSSSSAEAVLAAVNTVITENGATKVVVTGHSLGGAIALLDGVYLSLHLSGVSVEVISYGMPRVGNQEFADYVDANIPVTHINNK
jgi:predicted lipase